MANKESFKRFVSRNPILASKVNSGVTTWQKLYETYDLYGEDSSVWDEFIPKSKIENNIGNMNVKDLFNNIKNMNMDTVQKNISSLQKAVEFLQDITGASAGSEVTKNTGKVYNPRPINKFFDD